MKTLDPDLLAHYQQSVTTLAEFWRVTRAGDGQVFGWTTFDANLTIAGVLYKASGGLTVTAAHTTSTLAVDTLDVTAFLDVSTEAELAAGIWDDSEILHFETRWDIPPIAIDNTVLVKRCGNLGRIVRRNQMFTAEIRGLADRLNTRIGRQYSPICPWRHALWNGATFVSSPLCGADLAALGFIQDGAVTAVGADATLTFTDTGNTQPILYYDNGFLTMTSGANLGLTREILHNDGAGGFVLLRPFPYPLAIGNTYRSVRGDDHSYGICRDQYLNVVNFGGFYFVPGSDFVYSTPAGL